MARNNKRLEIYLANIKILFFFRLANSNLSVSGYDNYPKEPFAPCWSRKKMPCRCELRQTVTDFVTFCSAGEAISWLANEQTLGEIASLRSQ